MHSKKCCSNKNRHVNALTFVLSSVISFEVLYTSKAFYIFMLPKRTYEEIKVGEKASYSKTISEAMILEFAELSGDFNPLHVDEEFAKKAFFRERVAHGMLTASLFSTVVSEVLGQGGIYISQTLNFKAPVKIGDTISATTEVLEKLAKNRVRMKTVAVNQEGKTVLFGEAVGFLAP